MSSRFNAYRVDSDTVFDAAFWNRIMLDLDTRVVGVEEKKADFEKAESTLLDIGLRRINDILLPAAERISRVSELGFLVASSDEEVAFTEGQDASITVREGDQRALFRPSPFIALVRRSTMDDYVIGRTTAYNPDSGILLFRVEKVEGSGGPFDDWDIAALAGAVKATVDVLAETREVADQVSEDAGQVAADKATAVSAKDDAVLAKADAEAALSSFLTIYRGALSSAPGDGQQGHFYFDTTLQQARVYTAAGWTPLFSVSLGGIRQDTIEAEEAQTVFTVDGGGFTFINVFKNGVLLVPGVDYTTASPDFTLTDGAKEGDLISYTAYFATEQTDFYTKEAADGRFVRHDGAQPLAPLEQAQARENIGLGNSATRNVGTTAGTVAAGDDSRITGAVQQSLLTSQGDIAVRGASGWKRLAKGTTGAALVAGANEPEWRKLQQPNPVVKGSDQSTSSSSYTAISDLSINIAPQSSSNRVRVRAVMSVEVFTGQSAANILCTVQLRRGSTVIQRAQMGIWLTVADNLITTPIVMDTIDSPSTTSSVTYALYFNREGNGTATVLAGATLMVEEIGPE